jgi:hypothetical protein
VKHPCPRYEPELSAYVDGETTPALRAEIETHLRLCSPCRAAVDQLKGVSLVLRRWDAHETRYATSTGFRNRVLSKLGGAPEISSAAVRWRIAAGLALVAAGAGTFALLRRGDAAPSEAEIAALRADVKRLEAALASRGAAPGAREPAASEPIERLGPLTEVVRRPTEDESPASAPGVVEVWEQHGDERILSDAVRDHDEFTRARQIAALTEQVRKIEADRAENSAELVTSAPPPVTSGLAVFLGEVRVAEGNFPAFEQVQVWPIELASAGAAARPAAMSCSDAIARNVLTVIESVSAETVVAENKDATKAVLVLAGDVLAGGRRDRVARQDVLIAPGERTSIPTYGSGRSHPSSTKSFRRSDGVATPEQRALAAADRALVAGGVDQAVFDASVDRTVKALGSNGLRGSLDNLYTNPSVAFRAEQLTKPFKKRLDSPTVVGFAFAVGSQILGVETFGDHATFMDHRARLLQSYVLSVLAMDSLGGDTPSRADFAKVLDVARQGVFHAEVATGSGTLSVFRGLDGDAFGFGLLDGTHVVHSVVFTGLPADADGQGGRLGRRGRDGTSPLDGGRGASAPGRGNGGGGDPTEAK